MAGTRGGDAEVKFYDKLCKFFCLVLSGVPIQVYKKPKYILLIENQ